MSEKRFHQFGLWVIDNPNFNGISIADLVDTELMSITEVVDKLNEQQSTIDKLDQENADLLGARIKAQEEWEKCTDKLKEKIGEQQATIDKVYELLKEEADIFSDEATEHDIKAYIELQEFDNKDAYYLACAIKKAIKLLKGDDV